MANKMRIRAYLSPILAGIVGILLVAALWSVLVLTGNPARFPSLASIYQATVDNFNSSPILRYSSFGAGGIWSNLLYTIWNVYMGVAIGLVIGFIVGIALTRIKWFNRIAQFPVVILGTVPVIAILPFLSLWFGSSPLATSGLVIFYTALTVAGAVNAASIAASARFGDYAASLGITPARTTLSVIFPAILPATIGVVRAAIALGWGFQCIAEVLGGSHGAGRLMRSFSDATVTSGVIGVLLFVGIAALFTDAILVLIGRWIVRWNE